MEETSQYIALEMNEPLLANDCKNYMKFLKVIETSNPHVMGLSNCFPKKYNSETHVFYAARNKEDADQPAEKVKKTGLVKKINVEKFNSLTN